MGRRQKGGVRRAGPTSLSSVQDCEPVCCDFSTAQKVVCPQPGQPLSTAHSLLGSPWVLHQLRISPRDCGSKERGRMEELNGSDTAVGIPKHILDIWAIVLIILATIIIMMSLVLCPATAVIIYRVRTHPIRNGAV
ncbi:PREDICTED: small integral membrane protein 3 [Gavialis gangeticus]|uniref:small integral membrane protein 3 n=1 Tax=Gavialis gangeticus TaxID=94835 RepID=UPI00092E9BA6|nr:PREDICTED: small integral membrane protein 3 [Gavialis gangeticus]